MSKRMFLAGTMTVQPSSNREAFQAAAKKLSERGIDVVVQAEYPPPCSGPRQWLTAMRANITELVRCDGVAFMHDWQHSKGAYLMSQIALTLGLDVFFLDAEGNMQEEDLPRLDRLQWSVPL